MCRCSQTPHCIHSTSHLKNQPNCPTGGRAMGRSVGQSNASRFFCSFSHTPCHIPIKFESAIVMNSPPKISANWPAVGRAMGRGIWQSMTKNNIIFQHFFQRYSRTPRRIPIKFESSVVMHSPIEILNFQPNWPTGGRATGRTVGQLWQKMAKIIGFSGFSAAAPAHAHLLAPK